MLYEVRLTSTQVYRRSANGGRHLLRLMPAELPGEQRMIAGTLDIKPAPHERSDRTDFFGNRMTEVSFDSAHDEVAFVVRARVERFAATRLLDMSPSLDGLQAEIQASRSLLPDAPHHFTGPSRLVEPDAGVQAYARELVDERISTLDMVTSVNRAIHQDMRYDSDATDVDTPMAEAFAARHGVCQDFSHVMIACLREMGIPAGYVSGFLRTEPPKGQPRLEGADAMHAWVRAWCGVETGWVEFDPTNAIRVSADHIVVARGRDYSDVAPVKGVLWTSGGQSTKQAVDVIPLG
jgi:transglutaminase-like putative cysteine protease